MGILTSLKRKDKSNMIKESRGSTEAKFKGMIWWMQETGPMLQEFARMNGLQAPNYHSDMFSSTPIHFEEGTNSKDERDA
ncbi:hypothetical protein J1N35_033986 [Gossypium stocksii]|uniref:Uncharacterized protein n=1 Tax=Gossypium stocksii TaxID=47602 RepID=A0A9D3UR47_9ROSI|nr:hypothetical protein J1N35_033986 [Gossypium stocksii]